jgi:vesicle-fusing ATPase
MRVKKVLLGIETAKQDVDDKVGRFIRVINRAIEEEQTFA